MGTNLVGEPIVDVGGGAGGETSTEVFQQAGNS
jgi:hypothetical protein